MGLRRDDWRNQRHNCFMSAMKHAILLLLVICSAGCGNSDGDGSDAGPGYVLTVSVGANRSVGAITLDGMALQPHPSLPTLYTIEREFPSATTAVLAGDMTLLVFDEGMQLLDEATVKPALCDEVCTTCGGAGELRAERQPWSLDEMGVLHSAGPPLGCLDCTREITAGTCWD